MKKVYIVFIGIFSFLMGCDSSVSNGPINEENQLYDFILSIKTDESVYEREDTIEIFSYFEYVGEEMQLEEIQFDEKPQISIIIENEENGNIVKQVAFDDIKKTMKKGEKFTQTIRSFELPKGDYRLFVGTAPFSIGPSNYLINTTPRKFEVK